MWKRGLILTRPKKKGLQLFLEADTTNPGMVTNCCGVQGASTQVCTVCSPWLMLEVGDISMDPASPLFVGRHTNDWLLCSSFQSLT